MGFKQMENFDELDRIKGDLSSCLSLSDNFEKFKRLGEIAQETDSSQMPHFMKKRIKRKITEHQLSIAGLLNPFDFDLNEL